MHTGQSGRWLARLRKSWMYSANGCFPCLKVQMQDSACRAAMESSNHPRTIWMNASRSPSSHTLASCRDTSHLAMPPSRWMPLGEHGLHHMRIFPHSVPCDATSGLRSQLGQIPTEPDCDGERWSLVSYYNVLWR